ncbi:MAG: MFS transporter [Solirubrobacterales bacterium]|nr:MFS transporter [Solirubrobacterales bacterium]MCB8970515.1 MFS transporter [Thermoleophilales bacterium]MCO5325678.1 MFS transporter [Solirubrobacterales bacterium]
MVAQKWKWGTLAAVCLAQLVLMLDVTVVIVALPDISRDLGGDLADVQFVVDIYALALAALLLNFGALADRVGRRRVFLAGLAIFGVASVLCAIASSTAVLIGARGVQGAGGAMLFATGLALLGNAYRGGDRAKALGVFGAVFGAAVALGPLVGGLVLEAADWRWIFFINIPVVVAGTWLAFAYVEESLDPDPRAVDIPGQLTFALSIGSLVVALVKGQELGWGSATIVGLFAIAAAALLLFVAIETRRESPMFDLALLADRSFSGAALAAFATSASLFGMFVYLTIWFQRVQGMDALEAGLKLLPVTLLAFIAAALAGRLSGRIPPRPILALALASTATGLLQMTTLGPADSWTVALPGLLLCGLGFGLANPTVASVTLTVAPPERSATAIGMNSTFRQVGVATGVAVLGAVFDSALGGLVARLGDSDAGAAVIQLPPEAQAAFTDALDNVFVTGAGIAAVGALLAALLVNAPPSAGDLPDGPSPSVAEGRDI